jgi:anti-sigma factor RsiW
MDADAGPTRFGAPEGGPPPDALDLPPETLMQYLDGELPPEERTRVEALLERSTELRRELAVFRMFHRDLSGIRIQDTQRGRSVWDRVHRQLSRPVGWLLMAGGAIVWMVYLAWSYMTSTAPTLEKAATSAVVIGILILFASVIHDRYQEWETDPYRDVER